MATTIQIKRSPNVAAATTVDLLEGELAYSYDKSNNGDQAKLYIEVQDSSGNEYIHTIGGKYYTSKVDAATNLSTGSTIVSRDSAGDFSANAITATTFYGNIVGTINGVASSATKLETARRINLGGDLQGNVLFDGTQDVTIFANVISNSVNLGTDTIGDYVANLTAGTGVTLSGQAGETSNITVSIGQAVGTSADVTFNTVTSRLYGQANTATALHTGRYINLSGDISGSAYFDGTGNADISAIVIQANSVTLGSDTSGDYVAGLTAGSGIALTNAGGESANVTVGLSTSGVTANTYGSTTVVPVITVDTYGRVTSAANATIAHGLNIYGNSGVIAVATNGTGSLTLEGGAGITSNAGSDRVTFDLRTSGVSASTYGGTTNIPVFTVDTYGRVTSASNVAVSTSFTLAGNSGTPDTLSGGDTLRIIGSTGINTVVSDNTISIYNTGVTSLTGTANEIEVSSSNAAVQIGLPNSVTITQDLTVGGNLYVTGNVVALPVETLVVEDPLIQLANTNVSTDIVDIGFFGSYGPGDIASHYHTGLFRDASDGKYRLFQGLTEAPGVTVNTSGNNYSIASLVANLTGGTVSGLTANIAVGDGGTGRGTFTTNGVLFGNATGALKVTTAGTAGQILQVGQDGVPVFASVDGGTY